MIAPPQGRPKGTVHFLGGAFAGASPQLIYPLLLQLLACAGYTVISTPYAVTFKHLVCAGAVNKVCTRAVPESVWAQPEAVALLALVVSFAFTFCWYCWL